MKFSESWLREWADPPVSTEKLVDQLTMAGLEVDSADPAAPTFSGVVVAEVVEVNPHPKADKLTVCRVDTGRAVVDVVCGAPNVQAGMKAALAVVGAVLPDGLKVRKAKLRGAASHGMLCSAKELGLSDDASGLMPLPQDARIGTDLREYLGLEDTVFDIELTPNRGDCLSVRGVSREVAAANSLAYAEHEVREIPEVHDAVLDVRLDAPKDCPVFAGRVIRNIRTDATTPVWMAERLRRGGIRPVHPVVDVTNYVMLEWGQPLHAYDLRELAGGIVVRRARDGEQLTLLDGRTIELDMGVLMIADHERAIGMAGIMGGEGSGIREDTTELYLESAYFSPLAIAGRARRFAMNTDASHRFERGVDPAGQARAVERATALFLEIVGGEPGPTVVTQDKQHVPTRDKIQLRRERVARVIGIEIPDSDIEQFLGRLGMQVESDPEGWRVTPPSFRFDIAIENDLVEEVARLYGYDRIPEAPEGALLSFPVCREDRVPVPRARDVLVDRGYQEAITYSFVSPRRQSRFTGGRGGIELANPISEELAAMRETLWPGLVAAVRDNLARQRNRVRLFEYGMRFLQNGGDVEQQNVIAGAVTGPVVAEQWGSENRAVDFYDLKSDVEALLALGGRAQRFSFEAQEHPALHPGQSTRVLRDGAEVGWLGMLHPALLADLDIDQPVGVFELSADSVLGADVPRYKPVSRFPEIRRDIAILVGEHVNAGQLLATARSIESEILRDVQLFDVYRGHNIDSGLKSIALGLILVDFSRTLTDEDADAVVSAVVSRLEEEHGAKIRD